MTTVLAGATGLLTRVKLATVGPKPNGPIFLVDHAQYAALARRETGWGAAVAGVDDRLEIR
ncbi:hypothetical protein [Achromobacter sp. AONIH1]|uniref:hypothetical protein n=1 Tax=Achromobacter sp. AONIH1 TaxID=1758194 RepID=UPI00131A12A8|nr:hypothetical protein [Achromobacter sp. AONIH1]